MHGSRVAIALVLAGSGCSLLFDSGTSAQPPDAATGQPDVPLSPDAGEPDAVPNDNNHLLPYTCDSDVLALYHFDDDLVTESCRGSVNLLVESTPNGGNVPLVTDGRLSDGVRFTAGGMLVSERLGTTSWEDGFSVDLWLRPNSLIQSEVYVVAARGPFSIEQFHIALSPNGAMNPRLVARIYNDACFDIEFFLEATNPLPIGDWTHVRLSVNQGGATTLEVNGQIDASIPTTPAVCRGAATYLTVGARPEFVQFMPVAADSFDGDVDELRISSVAR